MRIYKPKNELGQAILNEGQLVCTSKSITKSLTGGAIVLTESDISGITNWTVKSVTCTIGGQEMSFTPEVAYRAGAIEIRFSRDGETIEGLSSVRVVLGRTIVSGIGSEEKEEELSIDVLIAQAKATGDNTKVDEYVDGVIAGKDKEEIQALGAKLATSDIEEYTLAGCKTTDEAVALMTGNMGAFSSPIATLNLGRLILNDTNFGYNMMSLEQGDTLFADSNIKKFNAELPCLEYGVYMFAGGPIESWNTDLPELTDGFQMFYRCHSLTSFSSELPNLTNGEKMFYDCPKLTSFTSNLPSLTNGYEMFNSCSNLTSFTSDLPKLTEGYQMFYLCSNLTSFASELPNLTDGYGMFERCYSLTSFTSELPNLKYGKYMFASGPIESWNVDIPSLTDGGGMFMSCSNLTFFTSELPSLTEGRGMFSDCTSLTYCEPKNCKNSTALNQIIDSLPSYSKADGSHMILFSTGNEELNDELTINALMKGWGVGTDATDAYYYYGSKDMTEFFYNLVDGSGMFSWDESLTEWNYDMPNLTNGSSMFYDCENLASFTSDLPNLEYGASMFNRCTSLTSFTSNLPSLTNGWYMFSYCNNLTSFTSELPNLTNGEGMFEGCSGLTSWNGTLPESLTNAYAMFRDCTGLTSWTVALPESLTSASSMFSGCSGLTSWTVALPDSLTNASYMFASCAGLTSWTVALPDSLSNASNMFYGCTGLTSWTVALPDSLSNASNMFYGCTNLTSFTPWGKNEDGTPKDTGATGKLTNVYYMFHNCKLDLASVKRIADWLPTRTSTKPTGFESTNGWIHIGVAEGVNSGDEFNNAISKMTGKNWGVVICVNGAHTTK